MIGIYLEFWREEQKKKNCNRMGEKNKRELERNINVKREERTFNKKFVKINIEKVRINGFFFYFKVF